MAGLAQIREAGWFITGGDNDPVRHLFVRLEERMDGTGTWTLELHPCRVRPGAPSAIKHEYADERDARAALGLIYALSQHLDELPTWDPATTEAGRWRTRAVQPTEQELRFRRKQGRGTPQVDDQCTPAAEG